jgi:mRNA-degrading endonuclease RelE of RelBE toxin-antitoxin system
MERLRPIRSEPLMEIIRTNKYFKSIEKIPTTHRDQIEAAVDRLESDLTGVQKIKGTDHQARLDVGNYRIFLMRQKLTVMTLFVEEVVRRTTTTYRKRS